ncbi:hypothetical protein WJX81_001469 [Elliptochloris bilobata]|uniref:Alpha-ketoglutarate-dependent dioxygenase AlkB-like domain-containing protein n=1 Tax=Elliptochloris bilobata TaxID=381761 RepID=A0AAW1QM52_9CHLO
MPRTNCHYILDAQAVVRSGDSAEDLHSARTAPPVLREAAEIVNSMVKERQGRVADQLQAGDLDGWASSYALANRYAGRDESVAPHTDKLTALGRRPVIASLSLGACRTFRVTRAPEEFLHEVPKAARVTPHPTSGTTRINLTFRKLKPHVAAAMPRCNCGRLAALKACVQRLRHGGTRHVYYLACDPSKGDTGCAFRRWDV